MKETEDDLDFHYNQDKRLENASTSVKSWYNGTMATPPKGFFESFVHTKMSRLLLITLGIVIVCCGVALLVTNQKKSESLSGIPIILSAFSFEDTVYVSLKASKISEIQYKNISENKDENKIYITVKYLGEESSLIGKQNLTGFYNGNEAFYRTTTSNYDILRVETELTGMGSTIKLISEVQKK